MKITTIGEVLIDMTEIGRDENGIPRFQANPGGAPGNYLAALAFGQVYAAAAHTKCECAAKFQFNALTKSLAPVLVVGVGECNGGVVVYSAALYAGIGNLNIELFCSKCYVALKDALHIFAVGNLLGGGGGCNE